jgi:FkbM family methyltransferase
MQLLRIINSIVEHPFNKGNKIKALKDFFKWQLNTRLNPYPVVYTLTGKSKIIARKGLTGVTGNIYCGLLEFADMGFLLHFLRDTDLFVDVGANVGVYTVLSVAEVGATTISIEPIPQTFDLLAQNVLINDAKKKVEIFNVGLGKEFGKLIFSKNFDTVNHVVAEGENVGDTIEVEIKTLDSICSNRIPSLIKIDVEGFETEVLAGASSVLQHTDLKAIIIELNGSGYRYGFDENLIHKKLLDLNFKPFTYDPYTRTLIAMESFSKYNTIYIRDYEYVRDRVILAPKVKVKNKQL